MKTNFYNILLCLAICLPVLSQAQEVYQDEQWVARARVVEVTESFTEHVPGTELTVPVQVLRVEVLEGESAGSIVEFRNDFVQLKIGDRFFLIYRKDISGYEYYTVQEPDRTRVLLLLAAFFVIAVLALSGRQGIRALVSLIGSVAVIVGVLLPLLLKGYPPVLTSVAVAGAVLAIAIVATHGFNMRSVVALLGTWGAVIVTGILAYVFASAARLSGFASDEAIYLNLSTGGELDFVGLLLGAIIIGVLGVLDDVAITQVAVVRELHEHDEEIAPAALYRKALRVGKEHVSALVNTLVLAYVGVSLPLLLLFFNISASPFAVLNQEIIATEIIRTLVGSIGLIAAVPLSTALAVLFRRRLGDGGEHHGHSHAPRASVERA